MRALSHRFVNYSSLRRNKCVFIQGVILEQIIAVLSLGPLQVQELCISAIISLSENIKGPQIATYYDSVIPVLKQVMDFSKASWLVQIVYYCDKGKNFLKHNIFISMTAPRFSSARH